MRAALLVVLLAAAPPAAAQTYNGFNMPCWWNDCYGKGATAQSLGKLADTSAGWVALTPTWYVADVNASVMKRTDATPTDDSLRAAIRAAHARGLSVALKPHVDVADGSFRALINPKDPEAWFSAYRELIRHYAELAQAERADMLVVGTELFRQSGTLRRKQWLAVIAEARGAFDGPLTYAANWYDFAEVSFWDKLDFIGIDGYFPLTEGKRRWEMRLEWRAYKAAVGAVALANGKPVIFTEFGISAQKGAHKKPWEWRDFGPLDLEEQSAYFETFLDVFADASWFRGLWQWGWEINPDAGGPGDKSMTVQGKPALDVLEAYFRKHPRPGAGLGVAARQAMREALARSLARVAF